MKEKIVGIILVTHEEYGQVLLRIAENLAGKTLENCSCIRVDDPQNVEGTVARLHEALALLDTGKGVLLLTDMFGGTPTNLSLALLGEYKSLEIITGVNLAMLVKLIHNRELDLEAMAELACTAGRASIYRASDILHNKK